MNGAAALLSAAMLLASSFSPTVAQTLPGDAFSVGADLSFLKQQEDAGMKFRDSGVVKPGLVIFRQHGYGWIRLRLFHTPTALPNDLAYTLALAKQAKVLGFKFLLVFHYSDTWADPSHQAPPKAWQGLAHATLVDSVYAYTRSTVARFRREGVLPDMIQIGNEINSGMTWSDGSNSNFKSLADLLKAGVRGVDSGSVAGDSGLPENGSKPLIMLQLASGGDQGTTKWFFDNVAANGVRYDVIGQSYYPLWHGTFDDLRGNLDFMGRTYAKDIFIVETAMTPYPDGTYPLPLTDQGQVQYLQQLEQIIRATPNQRGKGLMWWEPTANDYLGTSRGLFDRQGNARPALKLFDAMAVSSFPQSPRSLPQKEGFGPGSAYKWFSVEGRRAPSSVQAPGWLLFTSPKIP